MSDRGGRLTAELGCGALILVIIAAFIGASAGTERSRSGAVSQPSAPAIPSIFDRGNFVARIPGDGVPRAIYKVTDRDGTWVELTFVESETLKAYARTVGGATGEATEENLAAFMDPEQNPMARSIRNVLGGTWWLNTAATSDLWQSVEVEE